MGGKGYWQFLSVVFPEAGWAQFLVLFCFFLITPFRPLLQKNVPKFGIRSALHHSMARDQAFVCWQNFVHPVNSSDAAGHGRGEVE